MGGSAAEAPTQPDAEPVRGQRASDAERDEVVATLKEEFAAGRLSHETFLFRMNAVLEARHQEDLPPFLADLKPPPVPGGALPGGALPGGPLPGGPAQAWPSPAPPAKRPGLVDRLRSALPRLTGASATISGQSAAPTPARGRPARRLTAAMQVASAEARRPVPLQFPRGARTMFSIGRDAGCDLAIADMTVSRVHARLERTPSGWQLTDLDSTNGTRVNGWLVRGDVPVRAGDLVTFGKAEYWLRPAADSI